MRIYITIFFLIFGLVLSKIYAQEYVFLQWDCSESLLFEGQEFNQNSRYKREIVLPFSNSVNVSLKNEIYVPLTVCELDRIQNLQISDSPRLEIKQGLEQKKRRLIISISPLKKINGTNRF